MCLAVVCVAGALALRMNHDRGPRDPQGESVAGLFEMMQGSEEEAALAQEVLETREPLVLRDTRKDDRVAGVSEVDVQVGPATGRI